VELQGDAHGPDGERLPLCARPRDRAQLIVQNADGVSSLRQLARLLAVTSRASKGFTSRT